jgi:hypothetical protein
MRTTQLTLCCTIILLGITSCNVGNLSKSKSTAPTRFNIHLTASQVSYSALYIDLQGVEITSDGKIIPLNVHSGIYNLVNLSNNMDSLIAFGSVRSEDVEQVKLILGPNNAVVVNGRIFGLNTPGIEDPGLRIKVREVSKLGSGFYLFLDFNVNNSIIKTDDNVYRFEPRISILES